jgi:hypothetical protein
VKNSIRPTPRSQALGYACITQSGRRRETKADISRDAMSGVLESARAQAAVANQRTESLASG